MSLTREQHNVVKRVVLNYGFHPLHVKKAILATGSVDVYDLMKWVFVALDDPTLDEPLPKLDDPMTVEETHKSQKVPLVEPESIPLENISIVEGSDQAAVPGGEEGEELSVKQPEILEGEGEKAKESLEVRKKRMEERIARRRLEKAEEAKIEAKNREIRRIFDAKKMKETKDIIEQRQRKKLLAEQRRQRREDAAYKKQLLENMKREKAARKQHKGKLVPSEMGEEASSGKATSGESEAKRTKPEITTCTLKVGFPEFSESLQPFELKYRLDTRPTLATLCEEINKRVQFSYNLVTPTGKYLYPSRGLDIPLDECGLIPRGVVNVTRYINE